MKDCKRAALLALGILLATGAQARIYGYIDEEGVGHFSNVPNDRRYKLYLNDADAPRRQAAAHSNPTLAASATRLRAKRQALYHAQIADVALALRLDVALVHAVIATESGYNPAARSDKGAMGLMQLMPETARRYCVNDPYDPVQNLRGGSQYLRDLLQRYNNDVTLALAAYNAGEGAVAKYGNRIPPYPETRDYVPRVMGLYARYRNERAFAALPAAAQSVRPPAGACRLS